MNIKHGIIEIGGEKIFPDYTFDDFKKSNFFENQDGIRVIYLKGSHLIGENHFIVSLTFINNRIYMISLFCSDYNIDFQEEQKRKEIHDKILSDWGLREHNIFNWGTIKSNFDAKGNVSSINIVYIAPPTNS